MGDGLIWSLFKALHCINPINVIYPSFCCSCGIFVDQGSVFCEDCSEKIKGIASVSLQLGKSSAHCLNVTVLAVSAYNDPIKRLVLQKLHGDLLASRFLAQIMYERLDLKDFDYLIPVPLHWTRYAYRGFNQADEMCSVLSRYLDIPVLPLIKRIKRTVYQSKLSIDARGDNVSNAFCVRKEYRDMVQEILYGRRILLIDDLYTTGSTIKSIVKILEKGKPASITAAVACRVLQ